MAKCVGNKIDCCLYEAKQISCESTDMCILVQCSGYLIY